MTAEDQFLRELAISRGEIEAATQHLYGYLAIHATAKRRRTVLAALNRHPLFWNTVAGALQTSALVALGRIFDQNSAHNIDVLIRLAAQTPGLFSKQALRDRKHKAGSEPPDWLEGFVARAYEPTASDFRRLRAEVAKLRRVYEARFKELRHKFYAHKEVHDGPELAAVTARANINELRRILSQLSAMNDALFNLFWNGRAPVLEKRSYSAKPRKGETASNRVHERISAECEQVLVELTRPNKRMEPTRPRTRRRAAHS